MDIPSVLRNAMSARAPRAPPGATTGKGTCGCCVSCSQKNPTFLWHLAQSPGAGLHPTILLLREEGENRVSEGSTRPAPPCTSQNTHQLTWSSEYKISPHQQQPFLCLSYQPRGQNPKLLSSSSTLGFYSSQRFLHVPDLAAHGWRDFVCNPHTKKSPNYPK